MGRGRAVPALPWPGPARQGCPSRGRHPTAGRHRPPRCRGLRPADPQSDPQSPALGCGRRPRPRGLESKARGEAHARGLTWPSCPPPSGCRVPATARPAGSQPPGHSPRVTGRPSSGAGGCGTDLVTAGRTGLSSHSHPSPPLTRYERPPRAGAVPGLGVQQRTRGLLPAFLGLCLSGETLHRQADR